MPGHLHRSTLAVRCYRRAMAKFVKLLLVVVVIGAVVYVIQQKRSV